MLLHYISKVIVLKTDKNDHTNCDTVRLKWRASFLYENETVYSNLFKGSIECISDNHREPHRTHLLLIVSNIKSGKI